MPCVFRREEAMPLYQPCAIITTHPIEECQAEFLDVPVGPQPQDLLLECADEALGAAIALG